MFEFYGTILLFFIAPFLFYLHVRDAYVVFRFQREQCSRIEKNVLAIVCVGSTITFVGLAASWLILIREATGLFSLIPGCIVDFVRHDRSISSVLAVVALVQGAIYVAVWMCSFNRIIARSIYVAAIASLVTFVTLCAWLA
jgi:hypothetical protein